MTNFQSRSQVCCGLFTVLFLLLSLNTELKAHASLDQCKNLEHSVLDSSEYEKLKYISLKSIDINREVFYPKRKRFRGQRDFDRRYANAQEGQGQLSRSGFNYASNMQSVIWEKFQSEDYRFSKSDRLLHTYSTTQYAIVEVEKLTIVIVSNDLIAAELKSKWEFTDYYGNPLFETDIEVLTDFFTATKEEALKMSFKSTRTIEMIERVVESSIDKTLEELLDLDSLRIIRKGDTEFLISDTNETIEINQPNTRVASLSEGMESTVTVKSSEGHGSGFFISEDGFLITNYHVVRDEDSVTIITNSGVSFEAEVRRKNMVHDLALLKIDDETFIPFRISENQPEITSQVYAIGTPASEEFSQSISSGIISGIRRVDKINSFIQTDAKLNPGNSGGPMIKTDGSVIGVVNARISGPNVEGIGFAIPAIKLMEIMNLSFK